MNRLAHCRISVAASQPEVAKTSLKPKTLHHYLENQARYSHPWLLPNVNRQPQAVYHLPWSSVSANHRKGRKWPSATAYIVSQPSGRYHLLTTGDENVLVHTRLRRQHITMQRVAVADPWGEGAIPLPPLKELAKLVTRHFGISNHTKINSGRGFALDPTGGAYSTLPDPLASVEGAGAPPPQEPHPRIGPWDLTFRPLGPRRPL